MRHIVTRFLVAVVFALLTVVPVACATSVSASATVGPASVVAVEQPTTTPNPTAPTGPNLTPEQQSERAKQKLVIGVLAVLLLGIVIGGRTVRRRIRKKKSGAVSS
ncbi:hypothetical protein [Actinophytocola sp.]|jgi:hypothetical protein|uniref:hypothetical protein n=1 Tax=Actinophytocola sp. TaxID=1872138 RepID=UPI002D802FD9|nr:hypothetical protein [Actinophytocola sp.]HET9141757.1 hypothetical protein [Actinophytocola sp.]